MTTRERARGFELQVTAAAAVLRDARAERMGFLTAADVAVLAADGMTRLTPVLVRCGGSRFTCPAQDAQRLIALIERDGGDYVRDVSLPARSY